MVELEVFENKDFGEIRTLSDDDEIWFVSADVCKSLNIKNVSDAVSRLETDEKGIGSIDTPGGKQKMSIINEFGLYNLVLGSRKPEARKFKRWVTHEVIPSIRKTGSYSVEQSNQFDLLRNMVDQMEETRKMAKQAKNEIAAVKDSFAQIEDNWRDYVNSVFTRIGRQTGDYKSYRNQSYEILNIRAGADVARRLKYKKERMKENGASKSKIGNANLLDVIEDDKQLTEIYVSIVKEFEAKYL